MERLVMQIFKVILALAFVCAPAAILAVDDDGQAQELDGATILLNAQQAAGGDDWVNAKSLMLAGKAVFYGQTGSTPRSVATNYRMWREYDPDRKAARGAQGKVRIVAKNAERTIFEVGYDGETTWTEKGIMPKQQADEYWANSFGFGIIRHAGKQGFDAKRLADDHFDGHKLYMVELTDPEGGKTLFGVDQQSYAIRTLGFPTPRGWHKRTYRDFVQLDNPRWLQARHVTLYYNDRKSNEVFWSEVAVDQPIDPSVFSPPSK